MKSAIVRLARQYPVVKIILKVPLSAYWSLKRMLNKRSDEILSRIDKILIGDITIKVEEFGGSFAISSSSDIFKRLIRNGFYEPAWSGKFLSFVEPGMDVVDVGANVGFYTVAAAKKGARVLAIEPTEGAFRRLQENVRRNGVEDRVILFCGLASDVEGERELHVADGREEYASMAPIQPGYVGEGQSRVVKARSRTLDSLAAEYGFRPGLMKVDTEGAELLVLRGGGGDFNRKPPRRHVGTVEYLAGGVRRHRRRGRENFSRPGLRYPPCGWSATLRWIGRIWRNPVPSRKVAPLQDAMAVGTARSGRHGMPTHALPSQNCGSWSVRL